MRFLADESCDFAVVRALRSADHDVCPAGLCTDSNERMIQRNFDGLANEISAFVIDPAEYQKGK